MRYADDFVIGFEHRDDAERVMAVLPKRLGRYGLTLQPDKTRLVPFGLPAPAAAGRQRSGHVRLLGVHALLAAGSQWSMGDVV